MKKTIFAFILMGGALSAEAGVKYGITELEYSFPSFNFDESSGTTSGTGIRFATESHFDSGIFTHLEIQSNQYKDAFNTAGDEAKTYEVRFGLGYRHALKRPQGSVPVALHGALLFEVNNSEIDAVNAANSERFSSGGGGLHLGADFKFSPNFTGGLGVSYSKLGGDYSEADGTKENILSAKLTGHYALTRQMGLIGTYRLRNNDINIENASDVSQTTSEARLGLRFNFGLFSWVFDY